MNDALLVSIIKRKADLDDDRNCVSPVQVSVLVDQVLDRDAFNIFLYDITELSFMAYTEYFYDI